MTKGKISSVLSMGTADGPGIRYVVFLQGCPLFCPYCHNPESKSFNGGIEISPEELLQKILPCKPYFNNDGGVTISGGEPLLQPDFLYDFLKLLKENGIHTALDTSGFLLNEKIKKVLNLSDLILLDIKMTDDNKYKEQIGVSLPEVLSFLNYLEEIKKPVWIRYVAVPGLNDSIEEIKELKKITSKYDCIEKIEILPFKKLCIEKYRDLNIPFPLEKTEQMTDKQAESLRKLLD